MRKNSYFDKVLILYRLGLTNFRTTRPFFLYFIVSILKLYKGQAKRYNKKENEKRRREKRRERKGGGKEAYYIVN